MRDTYTIISGIIFGVVAIAHVVRAVNQWAIQVGPYGVPVWISWAGVVVAGGLCIWAFMSRAQ